MKKKKIIKMNKDETLETIEQELNSAIQYLDDVNQKVSEILKESQKIEEIPLNNQNDITLEPQQTEQTNTTPENN
ncbi:MAG TPA: hypothetical protein PLT82_01675 [Candidatus Hydrogenedens sp.]|nr:hypothetical protein [Candidatus Hydrogenedens sp.]HOK08511.1 hypothetical protein [Candidatus Hydrogenedens sp.]HPP57819.1 hypothetical protein [Candidatus Hydrogenedens sp.]